MGNVKIELMPTMQQADEILFRAKWKQPVHRLGWLPLLQGFVLSVQHIGKSLSSWLTAVMSAAFITLLWALLNSIPRRIVLLPDRLRFGSSLLGKEVRYRNMRAISLSRLSQQHPQLSIKLLNPRYTTVNDIVIPPEFCSEILQILAREAPQAEMNELAVKWRDGRAN